MKALVLGAAGHYGRMICEQLQRIPGVEVIAAGRNEAKVAAVASQLDIPHGYLDATDDRLTHLLEDWGINLVINATGPFQTLDPSVALHCIEARCYYVDIADTRSYVKAIERLNERAVANNVTILTGMGLAAVNCAVIEYMAAEFSKVEAIQMGYSSSGIVPGAASFNGALSQCGLPVHQIEGGTAFTYTAMHGRNWRYFGRDFAKRGLINADAPEVEALKLRFNPSTVRFQKGYSAFPQNPLIWLAKLVKFGFLSSAAPFAGIVRKLARWVQPISGKKSGLFVDLEGRDYQDRQVERTFEIHFEQGGEEILISPVIAYVKNLMQNDLVPPPGAYAGFRQPLVSVTDILELLDPNHIYLHDTGIVQGR
ncbi:saccharopine dehydrogenase-like NADP-dependent oxidoreductase [Pseudomonas nitritireducens]|uniref:Saccharopine dehydrogenase-like NADP-dependent oxidoreductase n=1 Tax=Pseudomonas nitroreducens TaxID=46680 RepID=A0A7W7P3K6_PSENT|nr:saccharopine dehydrogenase NADP-binding domain-containing protein [Pseudomonas nitritireducens]MBB4865342.1 saccharopine dehydrogenase-like NADP-dependent oxidoreductase [Pseudomonas nitritireducens]